MVKVQAQDRGYNMAITGNIGKAYQYGERIYGQTYYGDEEVYDPASEYGARIYGDFLYGETKNLWGIYQRRHERGKVNYNRLKFYIPSNPRTVPQQANRTKFTNGMTAWSNLTDEQKAVYNERAKVKKVYGVNLFLREYLNSN